MTKFALLPDSSAVHQHLVEVSAVHLIDDVAFLVGTAVFNVSMVIAQSALLRKGLRSAKQSNVSHKACVITKCMFVSFLQNPGCETAQAHKCNHLLHRRRLMRTRLWMKSMSVGC